MTGCTVWTQCIQTRSNRMDESLSINSCLERDMQYFGEGLVYLINLGSCSLSERDLHLISRHAFLRSRGLSGLLKTHRQILISFWNYTSDSWKSIELLFWICRDVRYPKLEEGGPLDVCENVKLHVTTELATLHGENAAEFFEKANQVEETKVNMLAQNGPNTADLL